MTSVVNANIDGLGPVPVFAEVTNPAVINAYNTELANLVNIFNRTTPILEADYFVVLNAITGLQDLAANGLLNTQTNSIEFITLSMANSINDITRSLNAVGFDPSVQITSGLRVDTINQWRDLTDAGLRVIFESALSAARFNTSLQAIIELEYVRTGNDQIFNELSLLEEASLLTQDALRVLDRAQAIKNMISPEEPLGDSLPVLMRTVLIAGQTIQTGLGGTVETVAEVGNTILLNTLQFASQGDLVEAWEAGNCAVNPRTVGDNFCTVGQFTSAYNATLDPIFNQPIIPVVDETPGTPGGTPLSAEILTEFNQLIGELNQIVSELDTVSPIGTTPRESSLQGRLEIVADEMSTNGPEAWILDSYDQIRETNAGNFQRNLTEAITTAESINDQQRQELRRQLFVFEEFYRSASAVLIAINQIISRMAQNIAGR